MFLQTSTNFGVPSGESGASRIFLNASVSSSVYPGVLFQFGPGFARSWRALDESDSTCTVQVPTFGSRGDVHVTHPNNGLLFV